LVRLLLSKGAALEEHEKDEWQVFVNRSSLFLTLHESKPTSLTVSWPGGLEGTRHHTVSLEAGGGAH
jgi:hypothetical protein